MLEYLLPAAVIVVLLVILIKVNRGVNPNVLGEGVVTKVLQLADSTEVYFDNGPMVTLASPDYAKKIKADQKVRIMRGPNGISISYLMS